MALKMVKKTIAVDQMPMKRLPVYIGFNNVLIGTTTNKLARFLFQEKGEKVIGKEIEFEKVSLDEHGPKDLGKWIRFIKYLYATVIGHFVKMGLS